MSFRSSGPETGLNEADGSLLFQVKTLGTAEMFTLRDRLQTCEVRVPEQNYRLDKNNDKRKILWNLK